MQKLSSIFFATIFGWAGWWLGNQVGLMTAMIVSVVASGFGWYIGTRIYQEYLS